MQSLKHDDFLRLFTASEPTLRAFVRRIVPTQNDASEVSQNTAIVLWQKFDLFIDKHSEYVDQLDKTELEIHFKRWALKVARFEALSWRRDKARDRHVFTEDLFEKLAAESDEIGDLLESQRIALNNCLEKLPEERRAMLLEAYSARKKPQEIASRTGKTLNAFYQWLHRIRLSLLKCAKSTLASRAYT